MKSRPSKDKNITGKIYGSWVGNSELESHLSPYEIGELQRELDAINPESDEQCDKWCELKGRIHIAKSKL